MTVSRISGMSSMFDVFSARTTYFDVIATYTDNGYGLVRNSFDMYYSY